MSTDSISPGCRRVRFEMEGEEIKTSIHPSNFVRESSDDFRLWWQPDEFVSMRKASFNVANIAKEFDRSFAINKAIPSYTATLSKVYAKITNGKVLSKALLGDLVYWTSNGHSRRGLETIIIEDILQERMKRRKNITIAILYMQERCIEIEMEDEQRTEMMRIASERLSFAATEIALVMGNADMVAVYGTTRTNVRKSSVDSKNEKLGKEHMYGDDKASHVNGTLLSPLLLPTPLLIMNRSA